MRTLSLMAMSIAMLAFTAGCYGEPYVNPNRTASSGAPTVRQAPASRTGSTATASRGTPPPPAPPAPSPYQPPAGAGTAAAPTYPAPSTYQAPTSYQAPAYQAPAYPTQTQTQFSTQQRFYTQSQNLPSGWGYISERDLVGGGANVRY